MALTEGAPARERADKVTQWDFDVYLNDKKVGKHSFNVSEFADTKHVQSNARFKVTVFLIPAYRYEHTAAERWAGQCLSVIDARTNANGKRTEVSGERTSGGFLIRRDERPAELPDCVMTFAYWNADFLEQSRLLNPQTGEFVDVTVENLGDELLEVRGQAVPATRFKLTAYEIDMTLWYSTDREWLALESVAKGGHVIRYELS
jgi:hypothetical protein